MSEISFSDLANNGAKEVVPGFLIKSFEMERIKQFIYMAAGNNLTVLITGETGTGKEKVAEAIHKISARRGYFLVVDCASLKLDAIESELFGHVKGSFTSAINDRVGMFEEGNGGTIFIDEISKLPLDAQAKFLRFLETRRVRRLGTNREAGSLDIKIIVASNVDLKKMVQEGKFLPDLYYRLKVLSIEVPPLRARRSDIVPLTAHFIKQNRGEYSVNVKISSEVLDTAHSYPWYGNVRELKHAIEAALATGINFIGRLDLDDLNTEQVNKDLNPSTVLPVGKVKKRMKMETSEAEKRVVLEVLNQTRWNRRKASQILGISYKTLFNKINKYNLEEIGAAN